MARVSTLWFIIPRFALNLTRSESTTVPFTSKKVVTCCTNRKFSSTSPKLNKEKVTVYFVDSHGNKQTAKASVGNNLLDVVVENEIDIDGFGACEGTLACSTCHLIFKKKDFDKLPEKPSDEELDMLDLAYGLKETSRLGCQIVVTKDMDGLEVEIPGGVADARESS
ncbi:hypothetical protein CHS0354_006001 [Potamilus streckersoni]|uniref:2Fe-2S ferredoxin-type domain-containing protein n=1 Tax=Potamilus streckersoni TaxID=2493646 RepID=A0AAE0VHF7_9BIVA|nr:hypothetical protein CHS0354_006001 [Potamilus streckersoni]